MGDDGIAPFLYNELKNCPELKDFTLLDLGVPGVDLISYVEDDDKLIIIDALYSDKGAGEVVLIDEKTLSGDMQFVSLHDFGIEQTISLLRGFKPKLREVSVLGIKVFNVKKPTNHLSDEIMEKFPQIKSEVLRKITEIAKVAKEDKNA